MTIEEDFIEKGKLPCGCEPTKCKCPLSAYEYMSKYSRYIPQILKLNNQHLRNNKAKIMKEAGKQIKDGVKMAKDLMKKK